VEVAVWVTVGVSGVPEEVAVWVAGPGAKFSATNPRQ